MKARETLFRPARLPQERGDEKKGKYGGQHVERPYRDPVKTDGDVALGKKREYHRKGEQKRGEGASFERKGLGFFAR